MAANRIETLRNYFNAGDEPTEAQFYEVMQTIGHKYYQGAQAKTAGFTAADGFVYLVTDLDGCAIVLPAPTVGDCIKFVMGAVTSGNHTITADATTTLYNGYALLEDTLDGTAGEHEVFAPDGTDDDVITMNGTTTGRSGIIECYATATNRWFVDARLAASGDVVTPFS